MHILVIGGGVIGLCSAYYLRKAGHRVTILDDQSEQAVESCSFGNAGMIVPSHIIPLAAPGVIAQGLRWMFRSDSPFYIRPRLSPALIGWLLRFMRAANKKQLQKAAPVLRDLGLGSRKLFDALAADLGIELRGKGLNMLYKTPKYEKEEKVAAEFAEKLGIPARILTQEETQAMEPDMPLDILGAVHYPMDAHLHPVHLMQALRANLKADGVKIYYNSRVNKILYKRKTIVGVQTHRREFSAEAYLLAAGSWSAKFARQVSLNLPLQAGKGYSLTINKSEHQLTIPSIFCEAKVAITPMGDSLRFAGTLEIGGLKLRLSPNRVAAMVTSIPQYLPQIDSSIFEQTPAWAGLRPCSPDGLPYIGISRKADNLAVATGHAMMGISLAPITGKLISEIVSGDEPSIYADSLAMLSPDRYG